MLTQRQAARLNPGRRPAVREVDLEPYLAWLSGALAFEDATFDEVARRLERHFDIDIRFDGPTAQGQLTARFAEKQPLDKVLTVVASVFDVGFARDGRSVTFSSLE